MFRQHANMHKGLKVNACRLNPSTTARDENVTPRIEPQRSERGRPFKQRMSVALSNHLVKLQHPVKQRAGLASPNWDVLIRMEEWTGKTLAEGALTFGARLCFLETNMIRR